jgi:hypothetical protein
MSSKNFKFLDRLRSKSFDKAIITGNNLSSYHYIDNFDNITEDECIKLDIQNREIYKKNMDLYENIAKQITNKNAMFKIDTPPSPPVEPNNYDKFISNRLRNVSRNVRYQSFAVNHLLSKGYKLIYEQKENKSELEFEPFEAIDIFEKMEGITIDIALKNISSNQNSPQNFRKSIISVPPYSQNIPNTPNQYYYPHLPNQYYPTMQPPLTQTQLIYPHVPTHSVSDNNEKSDINSLSSSPKQHIYGPPASHYMHS